MRIRPVISLASSTLAFLMLLGCGGADRAPRTSSVCNLVQQSQRLVQVDAVITTAGDGSTVLSDDSCPAMRIDMALTNAALRSGVREQLAESLRAAAATTPPQRVTARVTGVLAASGNTFTVEKLEALQTR